MGGRLSSDYDKLGRTTKVTDPLAYGSVTAYNDGGPLSARTDQRGWQLSSTHDSA